MVPLSQLGRGAGCIMQPSAPQKADQVQFLAGGGELGALTRAYDWAQSTLGSPGQWPQSLRTAVRLMLTSRHPMFIWWGPDLIQFYNDAYRETMGPERHPSALGDRGRDCWAEIWPIIGPQIELVMRGEGATWHEDQLVPVTRFGSLQDVWWTYGYSPIDADDGVGGVLVVCNDVTQEHLSKEALAEATVGDTYAPYANAGIGSKAVVERRRFGGEIGGPQWSTMVHFGPQIGPPAQICYNKINNLWQKSLWSTHPTLSAIRQAL